MIKPNEIYKKIPCSVVAMGCAIVGRAANANNAEWLKFLIHRAKENGLTDDGFLSLDSMNKFIRQNVKVKRKTSYKRGERPLLRDFLKEHKERYIICVYGHFIYAENGYYYSFFNNDSDSIVATWELFTMK